MSPPHSAALWRRALRAEAARRRKTSPRPLFPFPSCIAFPDKSGYTMHILGGIAYGRAVTFCLFRGKPVAPVQTQGRNPNDQIRLSAAVTNCDSVGAGAGARLARRVRRHHDGRLARRGSHCCGRPGRPAAHAAFMHLFCAEHRRHRRRRPPQGRGTAGHGQRGPAHGPGAHRGPGRRRDRHRPAAGTAADVAGRRERGHGGPGADVFYHCLLRAAAQRADAVHQRRTARRGQHAHHDVRQHRLQRRQHRL